MNRSSTLFPLPFSPPLFSLFLPLSKKKKKETLTSEKERKKKRKILNLVSYSIFFFGVREVRYVYTILPYRGIVAFALLSSALSLTFLSGRMSRMLDWREKGERGKGLVLVLVLVRGGRKGGGKEKRGGKGDGEVCTLPIFRWRDRCKKVQYSTLCS